MPADGHSERQESTPEFSARRNHDGCPCDCPHSHPYEIVRRFTLTALCPRSIRTVNALSPYADRAIGRDMSELSPQGGEAAAHA